MPFKDRNKRLAYQAAYNATNLSTNTNYKGQDIGKSTAACELFVRADLSARGFEVTVPVSPTARHDLHVELPSVGWKGVQIKAGQLNKKTGELYLMRPKKSIMSPILALVHIPTRRIDYRPGTEPVPEELIDEHMSQLRPTRENVTEQSGNNPTDNQQGKEWLPAGPKDNDMVLQ